MAKPEGPPGQQKLHTIRNTNTGETKQITQEEWKENHKQLQEEGWVRVDEDAEVTPHPAP